MERDSLPPSVSPDSSGGSAATQTNPQKTNVGGITINAVCIALLWATLVLFFIQRVVDIDEFLPWWVWVGTLPSIGRIIFYLARRKPDKLTLAFYLFFLFCPWTILGLLFASGRCRALTFAVFRRLGRYANRVTGIRAMVIYLCPLLLITFMLLAVNGPIVPRVVIILTVILIELLMISVIRLAIKPLRLFSDVLQMASVANSWMETAIKTAAQSFTSEAIGPLPKNMRTLPDAVRQYPPGQVRLLAGGVLLGYGWMSYWLTQAVDSIVNRLIVPLFSVVITATFLLVVTEYACIYYALQHVDNNAFEKLGTSFFGCWAYSLTVLTTSPIANVTPATPLAWFTYGAELSCTFLLVSVLLTMFCTALGYQGEVTRNEVATLVRNNRTVLLRQLDLFLEYQAPQLLGEGASADWVKHEGWIFDKLRTLRDSLRAVASAPIQSSHGKNRKHCQLLVAGMDLAMINRTGRRSHENVER